jgi:hypothetical protein
MKLELELDRLEVPIVLQLLHLVELPRIGCIRRRVSQLMLARLPLGVVLQLGIEGDRRLDLVQSAGQLGAFLGQLVIDRRDFLGQVGDQFGILFKLHCDFDSLSRCGLCSGFDSAYFVVTLPLAGDLIVLPFAYFLRLPTGAN